MDVATARNVFAIGPGKKIKLIIDYPMSIGRNFDTVLQAIESLKRTPRFWPRGASVLRCRMRPATR